MSDLIAIGYPDEATADEAADEARRLAQDLIIQPDAIAVIVRDKEGKYHTHTSHHARRCAVSRIVCICWPSIKWGFAQRRLPARGISVSNGSSV